MFARDAANGETDPPGANIEPVMGLTPMSYDCLAVIVNYRNTHYSPCLLQVGPF